MQDKRFSGEGLLPLSRTEASELVLGLRCPFLVANELSRPVAELALVSGAIVVPVTVSMDITGHAELRFLPPLEIPTSDRQQQIESLVREYADLLRSEWIEKTGNLSWREMEAFLKLPLIDQ